ncbi:MAG: exodeoxyribonuclease VII large subunit [Oscillospiraceae bacterium]|nr:exodeoxyribonuclease VII large subunit [Candidatus Ruminococcus equi]
MITPKILSVSQLNFYVKSLLDNDEHLRYVFIEGEISNLTDHYSSGHLYFSLKDSKSVIRCVMFSGCAKGLKFKPKDNMKVIARGRVGVYEATGQYQFYVEDMQPDGIGTLALQFEELKKKLEKEGLFSNEHKKPIPKTPNSIGIITSPTGAAVQDILNILSRRFPSVDIVMHPVLVQGDNAAKDLTNAIKTFTDNPCVDVIIIGRGGGSIEDLWAFNDENLARAIFDCPIPVISAVGHETDFTICDFVSDLRAPTPSAAAELAVPDREELLAELFSTKHYIDTIIDTKLLKFEKELERDIKLVKAYSPENILKINEKELYTLTTRTETAINTKFSDTIKTYEILAQKAEMINPIGILNRGFSYVTKNGKCVCKTDDISISDTLDITLSKGKIKAEVKEIL